MTQRSLLEFLFYLVFSSQVLLLSFYLPRQVLRRLSFVVKNYPPTEYPKLYPMEMGKVERAKRTYRAMNLLALLVGLSLVFVGLGRPGAIDWDNELIPLAFMMLQFSPLVVAAAAGFAYFNLMREADTRRRRKAELRPRSLFDFISPAEAALAVVVYVAFVLFIIYVRQFGFPWFGGYWNIAIVTAANLFFAWLILRALYGKKKDPYQLAEDRARQIRVTIRSLVWTSILLTGHVAITIGLSALELTHLQPIALSLYVQAIALISFRALRIDDVNFEVYRQEPAATC